jgi:hypothetical protein
MTTEQPVVIDGITLEPASADGQKWMYVPSGPVLELGPRDTPMLSVIEAGAVAFLQCTARVALNDAPRARLLARLQQVRPAAKTLEISPILVERVALELKTADGWNQLAASRSSGMPPWTAALSATLNPAALAAMKSAVAGERGHIRLTARIVRTPMPAVYQHAESASTTRVDSSYGTSTSSFAAATHHASPATPARALDLDTDVAEFFRKGD